MKIILKRGLVLLLAALMAFTSLLPSFAEDASNVSAETTSGFTGHNAFDVIADNLSSIGDNDDYAISYLELHDGKAYVDIGNVDVCDVVVAIYDEDTMQMVTSGTAQVPVEHQAVEVELAEAEMPAYYVAKAFLLDENHNALCKEYTSLMYTGAYEEFLAQTPEDFKDDAVIVFKTDEGKEREDFAVLTDGAVVEDATDGMTITYDEATATYTFYNATKEAKKLSKGDVYYYQYGERSNEFLLFKVKSIKVSGATVTVVQDTNIGLADIFQFVRIDADGDYSTITTNQEEFGDALTINPANGTLRALQRAKSDPEFNIDTGELSKSVSLKLKWNIYQNGSGGDKDDATVKASVTGSLVYKFSTSAKLIYDVKLFGKDYYEFQSTIKQELTISSLKVEGKITVPKDKCSWTPAKFPVGPFTMKIKLNFILEFSASITMDLFRHTEQIIATADNTNGMQKTEESKNDWKPVSVKDKLALKIGLGVDFKLLFAEYGKDDDAIVSFTIGGSIGVKFSGDPSTVSVWKDEYHDCIACIYGDLSFFIEWSVSLSINIVPKIVEFSWDAVPWSYEKPLFDFHISLNKDGISCGKGMCDRISYAVTFEVDTLKQQGSVIKSIPLADVTVSSTTGVCDADGDEKYDDMSTKTDKNGKAVFYFRPGTHTVTASLDGYKEETVTLNVLSQKKSEYITMHKKGKTDSDDNTNPDDITEPQDQDMETIVESGSCGDNITYTLTSNGLLTINGTGDMGNYNYDAVSTGLPAPWGGSGANAQRVKAVVIKNGVTSIGDGAFLGCTGLTSVTIPDSVTSIRIGAFNGCTGLASVTIGNGVTSIGSYAFYDCTNLASVTIGNGVTNIARYAFSNTAWIRNQPDGLVYAGKVAYKYKGTMPSNTAITLRNDTKGVAGGAFYDCTGLTSVTIPDSVTNIGWDTFSGCTNLTKVIINSLQAWCEISFDYWLSNPLYYAKHLYLNGTEIKDLVIPDVITSINNYAFYGYAGLTSVIIPDSVTSIGSLAFGDCVGLTWVTIPDSVTSIKFRAFYGCSKLNHTYYSGTLEQWKEINIGAGNDTLNANITYNYNSSARQAAATRTSLFSSFFRNSVSVAQSITKTDAVKGGEYVLLVVKDAKEENLLSADNLLYIDQQTAESETVTLAYVPRETVTGAVAAIYGADKVSHVHKYTTAVTKEPTCTKTGEMTYTCSCGDSCTETIPATGKHTWNSGKITTAATCKAIGAKTFTCTVCSATKTEKIAKDANNHVDGTEVKNTVAATCGADGYTGDTYCRGCGEKLSTGTAIPATGKHTWNGGEITTAATCKTTGVMIYTCSVCQTIKTEMIAATGHKLMKTAAKTATCTDAGNVEYYTCSVCKKTFSDAKGTKEITEVTVKATGHSFGEWKVTKEATIKEEGTETGTCSKCGLEKTRPIAKLEITYTLGDVDGDGNISAADARLALRRSVGLEIYEEGSPAFLACDVDFDSNISAADARLILRASVGLEDIKKWGKQS